MKKGKIFAMIMTVATIFMIMGNVLAYDITSARPGILISPNPNATRDSITVLLNGDSIDFTDENGNVVEPQIINGRTMVPMRKIFEVFDADVEWDGETQKITATTAEKTLNLQIGNTEASITSGDEILENITLDSAPVIKGGRTLVPVRFIAESLDLNVGWEAETKTVVILDIDFIFERLKSEAPTFYEYMTAEYDIPNTYESNLNLTGILKYIDNENSKNNTNLKAILTGTGKQSEELIGADLEIKTSGKGMLLDVIKEYGFEKITMNVLMDSDLTKMYVKSSLLESEIGKKWAELPLDVSMEDMGELMQENMNVEDALRIILNEMQVTSSTYDAINEILNVVCPLMSDEYFTVTGRTTKVYTYEISLEEILELLELGLSEEEIELINEMAKFEIEISTKIKDNVAIEENTKIFADVKMEEEEIEITIEAKETVGKINQKVKINLPDEDEIITAEELEANREEDEIVQRAKYSQFVNALGENRTMLQTVAVTVKGYAAMNGFIYTDAQIYNYIARAENLEIENPVVDVTRAEANEIACTKINVEKFENSTGENLLTLNSEDYNPDFYITKTGTVFAWPPYEYENELYITAYEVVTDGQYGEAIKADEADSIIYDDDFKIYVDGIEIEVGKYLK